LIYKDRQKELNKYGIKIRHSGVLYTVIRLGGEATLEEIAQQMFLETHSVSELLTRMETQGLIKKGRDTKRNNKVVVEATEKGYEAYKKSTVQESIKDIMGALTSNEKVELWSLLSKIRNRTMERLGMETADLFPPTDHRKLRDIMPQTFIDEQKQ